MDELTFQAPVRLGHVAILDARVNAAFSSCMEVEVEVFDEDPDTGVRRRCCDGILTFVSLGKDNRPAPVAPVRAAIDEERQRERDALARRTRRLASRPPRQPR
jgi:acyl-CoA hydrolase